MLDFSGNDIHHTHPGFQASRLLAEILACICIIFKFPVLISTGLTVHHLIYDQPRADGVGAESRDLGLVETIMKDNDGNT